MNGERLVQKIFEDNWPIRRRWLGLSLVWLAVNVDVLLFWKGLDALTVQITAAMLASMVTLIGCYVFGAVWDDHSKRARMSPIIVPQQGSDAPCDDPGASGAASGETTQ